MVLPDRPPPIYPSFHLPIEVFDPLKGKMSAEPNTEVVIFQLKPEVVDPLIVRPTVQKHPEEIESVRAMIEYQAHGDGRDKDVVGSVDFDDLLGAVEGTKPINLGP